MRCAAFKECGGLRDANGYCGVCFAPSIHMEAGGLQSSTVGGSITIPLVLSNNSSVGRPLVVQGVWMREGKGEWSECELAWDRIEAGASNPITLVAEKLNRAGSHRVEIVVALASRWNWREETLAFSTGLEIVVEDEKEISIQQNIHYSGDSDQTGATIYAPFRIAANRDSKPDPVNSQPRQLPLTRASVYERSLGLRGMDGVSVKRDSKFIWQNFDSAFAPMDGPIVSADSVLHFGRSQTKANSGPNDVRILVIDPDGSLNENLSCGISRVHFCVWIENDRLMLRVESGRGILINGNFRTRGESVCLGNGSQINLLKDYPAVASIQVTYDVEHADVVAIRMTKVA